MKTTQKQSDIEYRKLADRVLEEIGPYTEGSLIIMKWIINNYTLIPKKKEGRSK